MAEEEKTKSDAPAGEKGGSAEKPESPWTALLKELGRKLLTALFAAGGLAAFVAFAGSVVLWTRFSALQLPADQIVDVIPKGEAVTAGAEILLLFGFCGAVAALAVYLIDRGGRATPGMSRGVLLIVAVAAVAAIWLADDTSLLDRVIATEALLLAVGAMLWATHVGGLVELERGAVPDLKAREPVQDIRRSAFRNTDEKCPVRFWKIAVSIGIAILVGAVGWTIAYLAADDAKVGWACGLGAFVLALLLAVAARWLQFQHEEAGPRAERRAEEKTKRDTEIREREQEQEQQEEEEKKEARNAEWARRGAVAERFFAWLRASWKQDKEGSGFTVTLGAPEPRQGPRNRRPPDKQAAPPKGKPPAASLTPHGGALLTLLAIGAVAAPATILGQRWLAITLAVIVVVGLGLWRVADLSGGRFLWYGLAVLFSMPIFATVALTTRNIDDPQAQPVAIIRKGDNSKEALQGLYVTETSDRVYFANVATEACGKKIVRDSGRLLWIPKKEVVAMSIGPSQDIDKAARSAVEMEQALTPDIETSDGGRISVGVEPETEMEAGGAEAGKAGAVDHRLEGSGPAVRPKFGRGLRLEPPSASPGGKVTLVLSTPEYEGFSELPAGTSLRLNNLPLPVLDERVGGDAESDGALRKEEIDFKVPPDARSGVVRIACTQLAGLPYLTVPRKPTARIAVRMREGSRQVTFDSGRSRDGAGRRKGLTRRWTVAGLRMGRTESISANLPPRLAPYDVHLEVTDSGGQSDTVDLRLLRLPESRFPFGADHPANRAPVRHVRRALRRTIRKKGTQNLAAIEIDGHADSVDTDSFNVRLSLRRARWLRHNLFDRLTHRGRPLPLTIRAFGESCPIVHRAGPQAVNRRVEVFVLERGATVSVPTSCHAGRISRTRW